MNNLLKADIEGVLEYVVRHEQNNDQIASSKNVVSLIASEVSRTRERLRGLDFEQELHVVLFRAWQQNLGIHRPYGKFHRRNGLQTLEYYQLVCGFDLWNQLARTLYSLSPEHAMELISVLSNCSLDGQMNTSLQVIYLNMCANLTRDKRFEQCRTAVANAFANDYQDTDAKIEASMSTALVKLLAALIQDAKSDLPKFEYVTDIPTVILNILNTVNQKLFNPNGAGARTISMTQRLFWTRLKSYLSGTDDSFAPIAQLCEDQIQRSPSIPTNIQRSFNRRSDGMEDTRQRPDQSVPDKHHAAFIRIFTQIERNLPFRAVTLDHLEKATRSAHDGKALTRPSSSIAYDRYLDASAGTDNTILDTYVKDCLQRIEYRATGWKSFLELVVDYQDIAFRYIPFDSAAYTAVCHDIASEQLHWRFFKRLSYIIRLYQQSEGVIDQTDVQLLCKTLMAIFKAMDNPAQRFNFRNQIFNSSRSEDDEGTDVLFGSIEVWSQNTIMAHMSELQIACNQIVEAQEGAGNGDSLEQNINQGIIDTLCSISVIMPYAVLNRLVLECIRNKGQAVAVQRVLQHSGDICSLQPSPSQPTLLALILSTKETIAHLTTIEARRNYVDLVCQWSMLSTTSTRTVTDSDGLVALLDIVEYFRSCLLPALRNASRLNGTFTEALPAFLQLLSLALGTDMESSDHIRKAQDQATSNLLYNLHKLAWVKDVNMIQLIKELATLLSFRTKTLGDADDKYSALSNMRFADWEACCYSLEVLMDIVHQYEDGVVGVLTAETTAEGKAWHGHSEGMQESLEILYERFGGFDWSIQLKLQPFLSKICRRLSVEEPYVALPSSLVELFSGLDGVIAAGISSETDTEKWTALMVACKSTAHIHDIVVKNLAATEALKLHPYENLNFLTGMYGALLPINSLSVLSEYKRLLVDFAAKTFDTFNQAKLMKDHDYGSQLLNSLVNKLQPEECRILHSILYSNMILQTFTSVSNSETQNSDNHASYFVASMMRVIQSLRNWSNILRLNDSEKRELERQPFAEYLQRVMPEFRNRHEGSPAPLQTSDDSNINSSNNPSSAISHEDDFDSYLALTNSQQKSEAKSAEETAQKNARQQPKELLFPPETAQSISSITLSVITLNLLAQTKAMYSSEKLQESIWILMSQIVEGLCTDPQRKRLVQAANKAGKASIKNWKKRKDDRKCLVRCRPFLYGEHHQLTQETLKLLRSEQERQVVSQKLDMDGNAIAKAPRYYM